MSFVTGFATGVGTGEVYQLKKIRRLLHEYILEHGIVIRDRQGNEMSIDALLDEMATTGRAKWLIAAFGILTLLLAGAGLLLLMM